MSLVALTQCKRESPPPAMDNPDADSSTFVHTPSNLPPDTIISDHQITQVGSGVDPLRNKYAVWVSYYGLDPDGHVAGFSHRFDENAWSEWSREMSVLDTLVFTGVADQHVFMVKAKDDLGAEDPTPAKLLLTIQQ